MCNEKYTKEEIIRQLDALHIPAGVPVLMHTSLRSIGPVEGGAEALLDILIEYFTRDGGLFCVPAHTWDNLDKPITLDVNSEDNCLGVFPAVAIRDGRGIRSENPTHSMVVFGQREKAEAFVRDELWTPTPIDPVGCHGKFVRMGGYVLLVGVSHNKNTVLHTLEEMLDVPNRMEDKTTPVAVKRADGQVVKTQMRLFYTDYTEDISYRFPKYETAFRYHRCITDGFLGNAPVQFCSTEKMKKAMELIYQNCGSADPLADEDQIPPLWYCV